MSDNEDYYLILGVERSASAQDIKDAYLYKVHILHPDRMNAMPERIRIQAEEDLKRVNKAYEILSDARKRAQYDKKIAGSVEPVVSSYQGTESKAKGKPKLEIYPESLFFDKVLPYVKQKGSFYIRNVGGDYSKLMISTLPHWIKILRTKSLYPNSKLPMQVDIEVIAIHWGKTVGSEIKVRLDETEAAVKIKVRTQKK
jgi:curved DNA-binding protein CbpA